MNLMEQQVNVLLHKEPIRSNVYGVEIEFENFDDHWRWQKGCGKSGQAMWLFDKDDSLRNGCELVSQPLIQMQMRRALDCVQKTFDKANYTISKRCSIHVHMNLLNLTWGETWSVAMIYALMEPEIFAFFGAERQENHFCVPLMHHTKMLSNFKRDATSMRLTKAYKPPEPENKKKKKVPRPLMDERLTQILQSGTHISLSQPGYSAEVPDDGPEEELSDMAEDVVPSEEQIQGWARTSRSLHRISMETVPRGRSGQFGVGYVANAVRQRLVIPGKSKYCALSAHRMPDLGTFEFRLLPATLDMDKVMQWVKFLGQIKHLAKKYPDPLTLQRDYERFGRTWLWKIFQVGPPPTTTESDREDADEAGFMIAGDPIIKESDMTWSIK